MATSKPRRGGLEVHDHSYISGPNARWSSPHNRMSHSHADGASGHQHPDTGPASYTIDKDEWNAATGMRGGGRKVYSKQPSGPQLALVALEEWQRTFRVVFAESLPTPKKGVPSKGGAAVARMVLGFDMEPIYEYDDWRTAQ